MRAINKLNKLRDFDKSFDKDSAASCVNRAMFLIKKFELQIKQEGYEWPLDTNSCRWGIEQAIINRRGGTMMGAAINYVESVEREVEAFNGIF